VDLPDVFTAAEAARAGFTPDWLARLTARGWCTRLERGVYVRTEALAAVAGDEDAAHLLAVRARLKVMPASTVAGHWSAVLVHGLPMLGRRPARPILTRDRTGSSAHDRFLKVAALPAADRTTVDGIRVSTMPRTVVDIARRASLRAGVVVADGALRAGLDPAVLRAAAQAQVGWPYGRQALRVVELADGLAESPLESIGRVGLHEQGLEPPELQVEVSDGWRFVARVDHLWEACRVIGEADGMSKYVDAAALREEKVRQEDLERLGFVIVRYGWDEALRRPAQLAGRFRAAFARGLRSELDPRVRLLRTVQVQGRAA
jgi:hypothetical protein